MREGVEHAPSDNRTVVQLKSLDPTETSEATTSLCSNCRQIWQVTIEAKIGLVQTHVLSEARDRRAVNAVNDRGAASGVGWRWLTEYGSRMDFHRGELSASGLLSLVWDGDTLVDWVGGRRYPLEGPSEEFNVGCRYRFDSAVGLGCWGVIFEALGTKGVLLRDNGARRVGNYVPMSVDIVREIDRSYYHADDYLYPVTLFDGPGGTPLIAHCPRDHNVLDLEDLDGNCLTRRSKDSAADVFHSRLQASVDGRWLLSNGWVWHPCRVAAVYDVRRALEDPDYLSSTGEVLDFGDSWSGEVDATTFVGGRLVCATNEEQAALTIYDLEGRRHDCLVELSEPPGTRLMGLGDDHVVLFDGHPRVINLSSGAIVERWNDLDGGSGVDMPSASMEKPRAPYLATDPVRGRFALGWPDRIVIVSLMP